VVAVDTDAPAIDATRRNAALNGFQLQVEARLAPIAAIDGPFDVIVANIGWTALVELASELVARMSPNGWIALSGISHSHCSLVAASLRPLQVLENPTYDEWSALVAGRRSAGGQL
jgi:ribosomal protein L11 methylase PrmA